MDDTTLPPVMQLNDLILYRHSSAIAPMAQWLAVRIRSLGVGEPEAYRHVCEQFGIFLNGFLRRPRPSNMTLSKMTGNVKELHHLLAQANQALADFEATYEKARNEMDDVAGDAFGVWEQMKRSVPPALLTQDFEPSGPRIPLRP